ncbi:MAG: hypothetical protein M3R55_12220 [Acidobacteriota bacterium]|nr:hypothetical protein [Acidobacteriota bacterium]
MRVSPLPAVTRYTPAERRVIAGLRTPRAVQRFLNQTAYNDEPKGATLKSFREVARQKNVHCLEAALFAAGVLEHHGYPPLLLSFESIDQLDHVLFIYQEQGRWGAIARSRDPGLHGREPVYRTLRQLAASYMAPFIDSSGEVTAFSPYDLRDLEGCDWRFSPRNVWKLERTLLTIPHARLKWTRSRVRAERARYKAFKKAHPELKPLWYAGKATWSELPRAFVSSLGANGLTRHTAGLRFSPEP